MSKHHKALEQNNMADAVFPGIYLHTCIYISWEVSLSNSVAYMQRNSYTAHDNDNDLNHFKSSLVGSKRQLTGWKPLKEILNCDCCRAFPCMETHSQNTQIGVPLIECQAPKH